MTIVDFPGAASPDRHHHVAAGGVRIAVHEWGPEDAEPLFLVHGGFDFARTYSGFAPRLARAGWRVIAWDQRGHGDSEHTALYGWEADIRDAMGVMDHFTRRPVNVIGHSKGGALMINLADAEPFRFSTLVNLDGMPSKRPMSDQAEHERTRMVTSEINAWLDHRRSTAGASRRPGTLDELARRRGKMNPRLSFEWLRYLASVGAREDADGWRWKLDPTMRPGGFGPWRPEWTATRLPGLGMPFLGILAGQEEPMGWNSKPRDVASMMPVRGRLEVMEDTGHFVHIEQPEVVADLVLDFLVNRR